MDPDPFFYTDNTTYCKHCSFTFSSNKHHFPHYTSNPLFSARPVRLTPSLFRWGKVAWLCCVQVPRCCWFPGSAPCQNQPPTPSEVISFSYWFDKPWFHTEGKLAAALIIPSSWGLPTRHHTHQEFLAPLPGRKKISARGVSHFQSLYFVFVFLSLFYFVLFASLYQKHKKK